MCKALQAEILPKLELLHRFVCKAVMLQRQIQHCLTCCLQGHMSVVLLFLFKVAFRIQLCCHKILFVSAMKTEGSPQHLLPASHTLRGQHD